MEKIRAMFITISSTLFSWLGVLAIPLALLLGLNISDYITGIMAAPYRDVTDERPIKSYKSIRGIQKKVCMYLLVMVGWIVDTMLNTTLQQAGFSFVWPSIFAIVITCWLIFNEIISLLENLDDIGVPIPSWLMPIMKLMRSKISLESGDAKESEKNEDINY